MPRQVDSESDENAELKINEREMCNHSKFASEGVINVRKCQIKLVIN